MTTLNTVLYDQAIELGLDMERVSAASRYEVIQMIKKLEKELIDGYLAMAREDAEMAETHLEAGMEVLK